MGTLKNGRVEQKRSGREQGDRGRGRRDDRGRDDTRRIKSGSIKLGSIKVGPIRPGSIRLGSVKLGSIKLGLSQVGLSNRRGIGQSRESLVRAVKAYAKTVTGKVTLAGFCRATGMTTQPVYVCFPQGYWSLLRAAGLEERGGRVPRVTKEDLLREFDRVAREIGGIPERGQLARMARYSVSAFQSHLGMWEETVSAYRAWRAGKPARAVMGVREHGAVVVREARAAGVVCGHGRGKVGGKPERVRAGVREGEEAVGAPLGFRGLVHAPTSELGVVHLFGLLGPELGIGVEHIGARFPDCRGVRKDESGRWRRVAIEFELKSSHFRMHRHDPEKCDLIVCWEHDWPGCPVEVMELRERVGGELR